MSQNDDNSSLSEINKTLEDRKDFVFISSIFILTSSITTYFYATLIKQFLSLGLMPFELKLFELLLIPQYLKILICPILDTFFIRKFGRRKTYIILILFLLAIYCIVLSITYEGLITNLKLQTVRNLALLQLILVLILEIAAEAWIVDYVYDDNYKFAAAIKYSVTFISSTITTEIFHSSGTYFSIVSVFSIIMLIYTYQYKTENDQYQSKMRIKSLCKRLKTFYEQIFERSYQIKLFLFSSMIGFGYAEDIIEQVILQQDFMSLNQIKFQWTIIICIILSLSVVTLILMKFKIAPIYLIVVILRNLNNFFLSICYNYFPSKLDNIISIYKLMEESSKAMHFTLLYILIYDSTKQKLSATMMIAFYWQQNQDKMEIDYYQTIYIIHLDLQQMQQSELLFRALIQYLQQIIAMPYFINDNHLVKFDLAILNNSYYFQTFRFLFNIKLNTSSMFTLQKILYQLL